MHDLRWVRDHPEEFDRGLERRGLPARAAEILALDRSWRAAETRAQEAQARRNQLSREIGSAKLQGLEAQGLVDSQRASREAMQTTDSNRLDFETEAIGSCPFLGIEQLTELVYKSGLSSQRGIDNLNLHSF